VRSVAHTAYPRGDLKQLRQLPRVARTFSLSMSRTLTIGSPSREKHWYRQKRTGVGREACDLARRSSQIQSASTHAIKTGRRCGASIGRVAQRWTMNRRPTVAYGPHSV